MTTSRPPSDGHFYCRYMIDPKDAVPVERLHDLGVDKTFECENASALVTWSGLDERLAAMSGRT